MEIADYQKNQHAEGVRLLFRAVYPDWDAAALDIMAYDEKQHGHAGTKVAVEQGRIIGQANVFWIDQETRIANLGYHVHPAHHRKGIGYRLAQALIRDLAREVRWFVVLTTTDNLASQKLCERLGFTEASGEVFETVTATGKYKKVENPYFRVLAPGGWGPERGDTYAKEQPPD